MRVLMYKSLCVALGAICLPALAAADSYLPLPATSAPVYRPVSSYYDAQAPEATGSSLISQVGDPPTAEVDDVPSPSDNVAMPSPAASYGKSVVKGSCKSSKGCGTWGGCGKGCGHTCGLGNLLGGRGCWYGGAYALYWDRANNDNVWTSVYDNAIGVGVLSTNHASMDWTVGGQVTVGRDLNCGTSAMEFTYWGLNPNAQEAWAYAGVGANLLTSFDLSTLNYDDGGGASSIDGWFDGASNHRIVRDYNFQNLELNFIHHTCCGTHCCRQYNFSTIAGIRYLKFNESFLFSADETDNVYDGAANEVHYSVNVNNHLLGLQLGGRGEYYCTPCFALHSGVKAGAYANYIDHSSFIGGSNGAAVVGAGPNAGQLFDINSSKTNFAMLAELDLGASYQLSCRWRATAGYRLIALSGVALPGNQIPTNFADIGGVRNIDSECSLILHGGYAGLECNF